MAQWEMCLPRVHKDPSLVTTIHRRNPGVMVCSCNPSVGIQYGETVQEAGSAGSLTSLQLVSSGPMRDPVLKQTDRQTTDQPNKLR